MVYRGKIQNGVVVTDGALNLPEGTELEIVPLDAHKSRRGSPEAIAASAGVWRGQDDEIDRLLAELKEMKKAEVEQQLREPEPEL
jgi:hypothetical protein